MQIETAKILLNMLTNPKKATHEYILQGLAKLKTMTRSRALDEKQWDVIFRHFIENLQNVAANVYHSTINKCLDLYTFFPSWHEFNTILLGEEKRRLDACCFLKASLDVFSQNSKPQVKKKRDKDKARLGRELMQNILKNKINKIQEGTI